MLKKKLYTLPWLSAEKTEVLREIEGDTHATRHKHTQMQAYMNTGHGIPNRVSVESKEG